MSSPETYRIGIDLGGTKTEGVILDPNGETLERTRKPTPRDEGYEAIVSNVVALIEELAAKLPENENHTLGMGIPGIIDRSGVVRNANTTSLIGHPLKQDMKERLGRAIAIENDANCFTMAECKAGAAVGHSLVFGVIMGTGCGGGLFVDGSVRSGPHGIAGEWGHFSMDPNGTKCWCGNPGCIETHISGSGVEKQYERRFGTRIPMQEIVTSFRAGEARATDVMDQFFDDFGRALGGLISIIDPDAIVLGGGLSNIDELYSKGIERVRNYAFFPQIETPILKNALGDSAGVFGAAWIGI